MILANVIESAFGPLISFFQAILVAIHSVIGGSWGWSIIGLTLLVRTVTLPLTIRQYKGIAQMRSHAPELDRIKKRYPDDKRRQQEETMKYYKEAGVNPLAACLPLVLQIPVFISLVYMLRTDLKKHICGAALKANGITSAKAIAATSCNKYAPHSASFLFVHDITAKATGVVLIVLMVLYVGTMVFTSVMMSVGSDPRQRMISIALPVVFVVFVIQFPAGLLVYWIATNLTTIPQQYFNIRRYGRPNAVVAPAVATNGRGSPGVAKEAIKKPDDPATVGATPPQALRAASMSESGEDFEPGEELQDLLETLVEAFEADCEVSVEEQGGVLRGSVEGPGADALVGPDGAVLEAVQHLAQRIVLRGETGLRVVVDADGYRGKREEALMAEADRVAGLVTSEGREIALRPMPAAERRFVHEYLRERGDVATHSEGDEPRRRLVVSPAE